MAVRIRLKKMGRTHRPFYRVCAFDHHAPRDGRALEELGTYDTSVRNTDARAILNADRIDYWLSVGAQPTEKVAVLIKKYGKNGTHLDQQKAALEELAAPRTVPDPGTPAAPPKKPEEPKAEEQESAGSEAASDEVASAADEGAAAEAATAEALAEEGTAEAPAEEEAKAEETPAEEEAPKAEE